jgi:Protein of unknown function (DUF2442)
MTASEYAQMPLLKIALVFTTAVCRLPPLVDQSLAQQKCSAASSNRRSWAKSLGDHRLQFFFTDCTIGEYDFDVLVKEGGPMVEPLRKIEFFRRVFLEFGAPTWPNGFDVAPEWLYRELSASGQLTRPTAASSAAQ